jgi:CRISPR-associated protein Cmr4
LKGEFEKKLVLVDDDTFRYFVTNATEIIPNIRIGDTGTTEDGSLRYTEFLPSETIMYSTLIFERSRKKDFSLNATEVMETFFSSFLSVIQIGGDETTGKGIVKLSFSNSQETDIEGKKVWRRYK